MLAVNRLEYITNLVNKNKIISVENLSKELNVSGETIRRDFRVLEKKGVLKRTYGGAYLEDCCEKDVDIGIRKDKLVENKVQIADICAKLINEDDIVFFDSSTTCLEIVKRISGMKITVITNSLIIMNFLSDNENIRTISLGGILDTVNLCFTGPSTIMQMTSYCANKSFVSCRSLSKSYGAMDSNIHIGHIRSVAIKNCKESYLVADHTKLGNTSLCKISDNNNFSGIITDIKPNNDWLEYFKSIKTALYYPE